MNFSILSKKIEVLILLNDNIKLEIALQKNKHIVIILKFNYINV